MIGHHVHSVLSSPHHASHQSQQLLFAAAAFVVTCTNNNNYNAASSYRSRRRRRRRRRRRQYASSLSMSANISPSSLPTTTTLHQNQMFPFLNTLQQQQQHSLSYSTTSNMDATEESNFSRYSKYLVKNSNGVDGMGGRHPPQHTEEEEEEQVFWVDDLGCVDDCTASGFAGGQQPSDNDSSSCVSSRSNNSATPRPFSILSWNVLAQSLYEGQYQRRRIQQVALYNMSNDGHSTQLREFYIVFVVVVFFFSPNVIFFGGVTMKRIISCGERGARRYISLFDPAPQKKKTLDFFVSFVVFWHLLSFCLWMTKKGKEVGNYRRGSR